MRKLMYRGTECTGTQFVSTVAATSGASQQVTFLAISQLMEYITQPERYHPLAVAKLAADVDAITYGQCKLLEAS